MRGTCSSHDYLWLFTVYFIISPAGVSAKYHQNSLFDDGIVVAFFFSLGGFTSVRAPFLITYVLSVGDIITVLWARRVLVFQGEDRDMSIV